MKAFQNMIIGAACAIAGFFLFVLATPLRVILGPDAAWSFRGNIYPGMAAIFVLAAIVGIPGAFGGAIVHRFGHLSRIRTFGFIGIAIGGTAHAAEMLFSVLPYNWFGVIFPLALPILGAVIGVMVADRDRAWLLIPIIAPLTLLVVYQLYANGTLTAFFSSVSRFATGHRYIFYPILGAVVMIISSVRSIGLSNLRKEDKHPFQALFAAGVIGALGGLIIARILTVTFR